jgi:hypothetical protein
VLPIAIADRLVDLSPTMRRLADWMAESGPPDTAREGDAQPFYVDVIRSSCFLPSVGYNRRP